MAFALVVVVVAVFAAQTVDLAAVGCVLVIAFALLNGLLVDSGGVLSWHGRADVTYVGEFIYRRSGTVPDLVFVLLSVSLFVVLALAVKGVDRL